MKPFKSGCAWIAANFLLVIFLGIGGWYGFRTWSVVQGGDVADGTVVELQAHNSENDTSYVPVIEYVVNSHTYQIAGTTGANPPAYHVGQVVSVRYNRADPSVARIDNFWELWLIPLIFIGIALPVLVIYNILALVRLLRSRR